MSSSNREFFFWRKATFSSHNSQSETRGSKVMHPIAWDRTGRGCSGEVIQILAPLFQARKSAKSMKPTTTESDPPLQPPPTPLYSFMLPSVVTPSSYPVLVYGQKCSRARASSWESKFYCSKLDLALHLRPAFAFAMDGRGQELLLSTGP